MNDLFLPNSLYILFMDFQRLGLCDELIKAIQSEGWE